MLGLKLFHVSKRVTGLSVLMQMGVTNGWLLPPRIVRNPIIQQHKGRPCGAGPIRKYSSVPLIHSGLLHWQWGNHLQSNDCPSASATTLTNKGKILHNPLIAEGIIATNKVNRNNVHIQWGILNHILFSLLTTQDTVQRSICPMIPLSNSKTENHCFPQHLNYTNNRQFHSVTYHIFSVSSIFAKKENIAVNHPTTLHLTHCGLKKIADEISNWIFFNGMCCSLIEMLLGFVQWELIYW